MELIEEGVGESSSPPRGIAGEDSGYDVKNDIYLRLVESGNPEAVSNPGLRDQLEVHFNRLPTSYAVDINVDRAEEVLLHQKLLADAKDPEKRPAFRVRFLMHIRTRVDRSEHQQFLGVVSSSRGYDDNELGEEFSSTTRNRDCGIDFEPSSKLEDLNLDAGKNIENNEVGRYPMDALSVRDDGAYIPIHEIIFSTVDKPKLLSQLSALLSDIGLNIREAHVFSTTDGYSLDVFVVDGWPDEETDGLQQKIQAAIANGEGSLTGSSIRAIQSIPGDWEIDRRLLKLGEKIGCGSCGHLYRGSYLGQDVAIKILRSEHLNETMRVEFIQELMILREVLHKNVVRFVGACTKPPQFCIVTDQALVHQDAPGCTILIKAAGSNREMLLGSTEYMHGGSLYDYLHKQKNILEAPLLFKFALDVCKGMEYLHQKGIIHRDLKTANLLMDNNQIVKVADFGVARFQNQGGVMTAETGTYRWMAPEVINHQPYDLKVDVFSFAIVLWELATSKIPYDSMTPLQAALGVRQGLRPDLPDNMHPKLLDIMQRCWETVPALRPSFSEIIVDLEALLQQTRASGECSKKELEVSEPP